MLIRSYHSIVKDISRGRFLPLLLAILVYLGLGPVLGEVFRLRVVFDALFSIILFAGIYAVSRERRQMVIAVALALPMVACIWTAPWYQAQWLRVTGSVFAIFFFGYAITLMGSFIVEAHRVTHDVVFAAVIVYLLIGLMWASIFSVLAAVQPGSPDRSGLFSGDSGGGGRSDLPDGAHRPAGRVAHRPISGKSPLKPPLHPCSRHPGCLTENPIQG